MKILVANNHLMTTGGTENCTFALIKEIKKRRDVDVVEYFCFRNNRGVISQKIESELGVSFMSHKEYDLIIANHIPIIETLHPYGFTIQTCHGRVTELEQPSPCADAIVGVSKNIQNHIHSLGYSCDVIHNGVDCERFSVKNPIGEKLTSILSLCQDVRANALVESAAKRMGIKFHRASKMLDNRLDIEVLINEVDMVVGVGRSLYDSMACGRCCISFDSRSYNIVGDGDGIGVGDGYLNLGNVENSLVYSCVGKWSRLSFTEDLFVEHMQRYRAEDGAALRQFALDNFNITKVVDRYIDIYKERCTDELVKSKRQERENIPRKKEREIFDEQYYWLMVRYREAKDKVIKRYHVRRRSISIAWKFFLKYPFRERSFSLLFRSIKDWMKITFRCSR